MGNGRCLLYKPLGKNISFSYHIESADIIGGIIILWLNVQKVFFLPASLRLCLYALLSFLFPSPPACNI